MQAPRSQLGFQISTPKFSHLPIPEGGIYLLVLGLPSPNRKDCEPESFKGTPKNFP